MKRIDLPDAAERYLAGETVKSIAKSHGVSENAVRGNLARAGVPLRSISEVQRLRFGTNPINEAEAVRLYVSGESEKAVATKLNVTRAAVREVLLKHGIQPRGRSEAMYLRMSQTTKEGRLELTKAAHAAVRGVPHSEEQRIKVAKARQRRVSSSSPAEAEFAAALERRGVKVTRQKAVGRYNVDVALTESSIAVEIFGGHWHASGQHALRFRKRTDYILDRGWLPIIIWDTTQFPISLKAIDYVIAVHQVASAGEPLGREEHVIRGDGEGGPVSQGYPTCVPVIACYKA